ncbi:hypothetical protein IPA_02365 [Ignicoccus pacificus DSM 13166]|uniref:Uncharacterized protein n=1 Tax=Ignicoccus pacificus DSM 13166 TaxID=940294 RepID=A0A977KAQ2_9CREN|nr:hypothetical protein IPA_02365 [Ignicoccus pacificus DSM 13166]
MDGGIMRRGLTTIEIGVLLMLTVTLAAILGSALLTPRKITTQEPILTIYEARLLDVNPGSYYLNMTANMYAAKIIDDPKAIVFGNTTDPYVIVMVVDVLSPGNVKGYKIVDIERDEVVRVVSAERYLPQGRHVIYVFLPTIYTNVKVELLGAKVACVNCVIK